MQITIPRGELREAVAGFRKVVAHKVTLPILGCVRFENSGTVVTAQVTDLDQHLRYRFGGAQAVGDGAFIVPLANLKDLLQGKAQETIQFETGDHCSIGVTNHVGDHEVRHPIAGMDPDDWPAAPAEVTTNPAEGFLATYRRLLPFAATDPTRYVLQSVYVDVAPKGEHPVTMVATDGQRLSCWNTMNLPLPTSVIVPTIKFLQWSGLVGDAEIGIRTELQKKELRALAFALNAGPWCFTCRTVDGTYPNWRQVIPGVDDGAARLVFTDEDVTLLRKVLPTFPGSTAHDAAIQLRPGAADALIIVGRGPDDQAETKLQLTGGSTFVGKLPAIGVNGRYLLDALVAGFRAFTSSAELCPLRAEDQRGGTHVLMPLRLGNETVRRPETAPHDETTVPAVVPAAEPKGGTRIMKETTTGTENATALDKVLTAVETARTKLRESASALSEVTEAIKAAVKEGKAQAGDLERARTTLQKLQAISL